MSVSGAIMVGMPLDVPGAGPDAGPEAGPDAGPLVGRAAELARLTRLVGLPDTGRAGHGDGGATGAVLLAGDAGIGKTRLLGELRRRALDAGWRVAVGHCVGLGDGAPPYLPFAEVLARLQADDPDLAVAHPPLRRLLHAPDGDGRVERAELFAAMHAALCDVGRAGPLLVIVEDVHWADRSTRDLLSYLFTRRVPGPVALVASYRSDDLHRRHPLRAALAEWTRLPGLGRLDLAPLDDTAVHALVRQLHRQLHGQLHGGPLREADVAAVVERAEGNAFFTEELVAATALGAGPLPRDLAGLLLVRLDQLDEPARRVVRAASAAGRRVPHALLARVAAVDDATLEAALRSAVEGHVLVPVGTRGYAFRHALLAEAVYDDLLPGERVRLHAAYVAALDEPTVPGSAAEVARHARAAHDDATALAASVRAAAEAMALGGPDEALRHSEVALELATEAVRTTGASPTDIVGLTVSASEAAVAAGRLATAIALVQDQLGCLAPDAPAEQRARLLLALATAIMYSDSTQDVLSLTTEALALVPAEPPSQLRARALGVHAEALSDFLRDDDAARRAREALELACRLELPDVIADARTTLARLQERGGDPVTSRAALQQVVETARTHGDVVELRALHHLAGLHHELGELDEALAGYRHASRRAREIGRPWSPYGLSARVMAAVTAYELGEWDAVADLVDVRGQQPPDVAESLLEAAGLAVAVGRGVAGAAGRLAQLRQWWREDGLLVVFCAAAGIDAAGDAGDLAGAIAVHDDAVACLTRLWSGTFQAQLRLGALLLGQLAAAAPQAGTTQRGQLVARSAKLHAVAERVTDPAVPRARRPGPEADAWLARVRAEHARVRWLAGVDPPDHEELRAAWTAAVDGFGSWPHPFERARSQTRLAAVLRASGDPGAARAVADEARQMAHRLGAAPLLAELRALGVSAVPAAERGTDALTPREQEVLALVAEGRSNREIGGRLYISPKTVSVHVSNVLAKLDAAGRTEAVAVARRRGLLT